MNEVEELKKRVEALERASNGTKVAWQERETESGIKLSGNSTVERTGTLLGTTVLYNDMSKSMGVVFVVKRDGDNAISVMDAQFIRFL
jgi:hypothetical protein